MVRPKTLFISNISRGILNFARSAINAAQELGYEFHIAANFTDFADDAGKYGVIVHHVDIVRNPFSPMNIRAFRQMLALLEQEKFDLVHCNTPIGGVLGRLCSRIAGVPKVIYTAHGFHFYDGAPAIDWVLYYSAERLLARLTDVIITISSEDYQRAVKSFRAGRIEYVPGIGLDTRRFAGARAWRQTKRKELGIPCNAVVLLSVGELNKNKDHETVVKAVAKVPDPSVHYLICGSGSREHRLGQLIEALGLSNRVRLLGFRSDVDQICGAADIFVLPSHREGLPVALMEAMASGLPVVCSDIRGNRDLIVNGEGGILCRPGDSDEFAAAISTLAADKDRRHLMGLRNQEKVRQFDIDRVTLELKRIYERELS